MLAIKVTLLVLVGATAVLEAAVDVVPPPPVKIEPKIKDYAETVK
jgi:hypothetical protein